MREDARYRFSWLIEFAHTRVVESYQEHPAHREFADGYFRPAASDRISVDFVSVVDCAEPVIRNKVSPGHYARRIA